MKYFLFGRPFRHLPTAGLYFLILGEGIILANNTVRHCRQGWPQEALGWAMWLLAVAALLLLALVFQAAVREYANRPDKPRRFWQAPLLLEKGSGEAKTASANTLLLLRPIKDASR